MLDYKALYGRTDARTERTNSIVPVENFFFGGDKNNGSWNIYGVQGIQKSRFGWKKKFVFFINKKKITSFEVIFSGQNLSCKLNRGSLHI